MVPQIQRESETGGIHMNHTLTTVMTEPDPATSHRYQIYRQARNGLHYSHGGAIDSPTDAVALFLQTPPAFEGGEVRLWDHHAQRSVASADWHIETTRIGFTVRRRSNEFQDPALTTIAKGIAEREALAQTLSADVRMTI